MEQSNLNILPVLPTEILLHIFSFLSPISLIKCRPVCLRWKDVIDGITSKDLLWKKFIDNYFGNKFNVVDLKVQPGAKWFDVFKSLYLWPRLLEATEVRDEFSSASHTNDEVKNFKILSNGLIGVHKHKGIVYYDSFTWQQSSLECFSGNYLKYDENDDILVTLNFRLDLHILYKDAVKCRNRIKISFGNVKTFILNANTIYYVNLNDDIFLCSFDKEHNFRNSFLQSCEDGVMCLGFKEYYLTVLSFQRNIYSLINGELEFLISLDSCSNLFYVLREFNFLEHLDWRIYFQWMYILHHNVPQGPLRDIVTVRVYGDIIFVGSNWGVLRIYHNPAYSEEFDLFNAEPVKQYNFIERFVLSICPIIQIDVIETGKGHDVLVAMPKKIAIISFIHQPDEVISSIPLQN